MLIAFWKNTVAQIFYLQSAINFTVEHRWTDELWERKSADIIKNALKEGFRSHALQKIEPQTRDYSSWKRLILNLSRTDCLFVALSFQVWFSLTIQLHISESLYKSAKTGEMRRTSHKTGLLPTRLLQLKLAWAVVNEVTAVLWEINDPVRHAHITVNF